MVFLQKLIVFELLRPRKAVCDHFLACAVIGRKRELLGWSGAREPENPWTKNQKIGHHSNIATIDNQGLQIEFTTLDQVAVVESKLGLRFES